ncbi:MAG: hypothetical protein KDC95_15400 [Planctomycetes bacterium]|nr:hypothetical protein [Planctomycetota bacterium]
MKHVPQLACRVACALTFSLGLLCCGESEPAPSGPINSLDRARLQHAPKLVISRMQIRGTHECIVAIAGAVGASIPDSPAPSYLLVELHHAEAPKQPGMGEHVSVIYVEYPAGVPTSVSKIATATFDDRVAVFEHGKFERAEHQDSRALRPLPLVRDGDLRVTSLEHVDLWLPSKGPAAFRLHACCKIDEAQKVLESPLNAFAYDSGNWIASQDGNDVVFTISDWQTKLERGLYREGFPLYYLWIAGYPIFI